VHWLGSNLLLSSPFQTNYDSSWIKNNLKTNTVILCNTLVMHVSTLYNVHSNHTGVTKPYTQCHSSQYRVNIHTSNIGHNTLYNYIIQLHYTTTLYDYIIQLHCTDRQIIFIWDLNITVHHRTAFYNTNTYCN